MKKILFILFTVLLFGVACSGNEFSVEDVITQPFVDVKASRMGLAVYVRTNDTEGNKTVSFEVTNPDGELSWTVNASKTVMDSGTYYGSSSITMPGTRLLDKGEWLLTVISDDGSAEDFKFNVDYKNTEPLEGASSTYSDSENGLVFLYRGSDNPAYKLIERFL